VGQLLAFASLITYSLHVEGAWKLLEVEGSTLNKLRKVGTPFQIKQKPNFFKG